MRVIFKSVFRFTRLRTILAAASTRDGGLTMPDVVQ